MLGPEHYTKHGTWDPILVIGEYLSREEIYGFYYASAITHLLRHRDKEDAEGDLKKARHFIEMLHDMFYSGEQAEGKVEVIEHKED